MFYDILQKVRYFNVLINLVIKIHYLLIDFVSSYVVIIANRRCLRFGNLNVQPYRRHGRPVPKAKVCACEHASAKNNKRRTKKTFEFVLIIVCELQRAAKYWTRNFRIISQHNSQEEVPTLKFRLWNSGIWKLTHTRLSNQTNLYVVIRLLWIYIWEVDKIACILQVGYVTKRRQAFTDSVAKVINIVLQW